MTEDEILRERLRSALALLEIADQEAIRAKRQLKLIFDQDAPTGNDIVLLPCRFEIEGHVYRAILTPQQRDFIVVTAHNHTLEHLLNQILEHLFEHRLYAAATHAEAILIAALRNQELPVPNPQGEGQAVAPPGPLSPSDPDAKAVAGACRFPNNECREPFGKSLCVSQGGNWSLSCDAIGPGVPLEDPADESTP